MVLSWKNSELRLLPFKSVSTYLTFTVYCIWPVDASLCSWHSAGHSAKRSNWHGGPPIKFDLCGWLKEQGGSAELSPTTPCHLIRTVCRKFSQYLTGNVEHQSNLNPWIIQTFLPQIGPAKASLWLTQAAAVKCWRRRRRILLRRMMSDATCGGAGHKTPFQLGKRAVVSVKVRGLESIDQAFVPVHPLW